MKKIVTLLIVITSAMTIQGRAVTKVESLTQILTRKQVEKPIAINAEPDTSTSHGFLAKDYSTLFGMPGFSDEALKMHFKLYQGYVKNTNEMLKLLEEYRGENLEHSIAFSEIKRRLMWEYDGMRLHELYFENLGGAKTSLDTENPLYTALENEFGSFDNWKKDFVATGSMRGIGWVVLYYDKISHKLVNAWINEHDVGHLAGGKPLLIMDVFEHAYLPDYGLERAKYIDAFFNNINWNEVSNRFQKNQKQPESGDQL